MQIKVNDEIIMETSVQDDLAGANDLSDCCEWVVGAIEGKIHSCRQRMLKHWIPILLEDENVEIIPASENDIIDLIVAREDYLNRAERDAIVVEPDPDTD